MPELSWKTVGHRGYPVRYPENTVPSFIAAINAGVDAIEFDIQWSKEGVPVVFHDNTLDRTTSQKGVIAEFTFSQLERISCHYPAQFKNAFAPLPIQSLKQVCDALATTDAECFIEIKEDSLERLGRQETLTTVLENSRVLGEKRRIISFDYDLLAMARNQSDLPIGWCLTDTSQATQARAEQLQPDLLIAEPVNFMEHPPANKKLWPGAWAWFIYNIHTRKEAERWAADGATYIETNFAPDVVCR